MADMRDRLLTLMKILHTETSRDKPLHSAQILQKITAAGISVERKSFYKDVQALQRHGFNVQYESGPNGGYWLEVAPYAIPETDSEEQPKQRPTFFCDNWNDSDN